MTLQIESLSVRYGTGRNSLVAVDNVDLVVPTGGTLGLVGESGCGKSTVARAVVGLAPVAAGRILLGNEDFTPVRVRNRPQFRRRVQMIFQDPYSSLNPRQTIGNMLSDVLRGVGLNRTQRRQESLRILDLVGLPASTLGRYPHQFSGGQRQRISIARALAVKPEIIICDEVTSALDMSVQATVLNLLKELQRELHLSLLFISHDLATVQYMSDEVAVMYLGRIVERAPITELFGDPRHPYARALISSSPTFGTEKKPAPLSGDLPDPAHPPSACRFRTRCPVGPLHDPERTICREIDPQLDAPNRIHQAACHFANDPVPAAAAVPVTIS
ncbi:MAG TPA: ABC transporter ATP-binding protein [Ilumatobacteraceae bacterium]